jgi:hypothetical protein
MYEELACEYVQTTSRKMRVLRRICEECRSVDVEVGRKRDVM